MPDIVVVHSESSNKSRGKKKHKRTEAKDCIDFDFEKDEIRLRLDSTWLSEKITGGELDYELIQHLRSVLFMWWGAFRVKGIGLANRKEAGEVITDEQAWDELNEVNQEHFVEFDDALNEFLEGHDLGKSDRLDIPTGPVVRQVVQGLYNKHRWKPDSQGRPIYRRKEGKNHVTLKFDHTPDIADVAKALQNHVELLSPETVDVLLILLNRLARLPENKDAAYITMKDIAQGRGKIHRDGKVEKLHTDLLEDIKLIAALRITMVWKMGEHTLWFGKDLPEELLHITDWEYEGRGQVRKAFTFRAGEPLKYFLEEDKCRLIGYSSRELLKLNPRKNKLAKKIGVYWILQAVVGASHGTFPKVRIGTVLDFCGESLDRKHPGDSVERVRSAFKKLVKIGLIPRIPKGLAPRNRRRGYFDKWLNQTITIEVNPALCELRSERQHQIPAPDGKEIDIRPARWTEEGESPEEHYGEEAVFEPRGKKMYVWDKNGLLIQELPIQEFRENFPGAEIGLAR
jgi:hypothetical protein